MWSPNPCFQPPPHSLAALPSLSHSLQLQRLQQPVGWTSSLCGTPPSSLCTHPHFPDNRPKGKNLLVFFSPSVAYPIFRIRFKCFKVMEFKALHVLHHLVGSHSMSVDFNCTEISQLIVMLKYSVLFQDTEVLNCGYFRP